MKFSFSLASILLLVLLSGCVDSSSETSINKEDVVSGNQVEISVPDEIDSQDAAAKTDAQSSTSQKPTEFKDVDSLIPFLPEAPEGWSENNLLVLADWFGSPMVEALYSKNNGPEQVSISILYNENPTKTLEETIENSKTLFSYLEWITIKGYNAQMGSASDKDAFKYRIFVDEGTVVDIEASDKSSLDLFKDFIDYDGIAAMRR